MKKVNSLGLPKQLAVFVNTDGLTNAAITVRIAMLTSMSGYPLANHVVGRIQRLIKLGSIKELLESLVSLRDLSRLAADILNTMLIHKVDRNQLIKTEVISYVAANAENYGMRDLTEAQREFVAYLITSSESHDTSWVLDMAGTSSDNLFCRISDLYRTLASDPSITFGANSDVSIAGSAVVYNPSSGKIVSLAELPAAKAIISHYKTSVKSVTKPETLALYQVKANSHLLHLHNINNLSMLRIVDHVHALLTNVDIWKAFISPRKNSDVAGNVERVASLSLMSSFFHSILMYPHLFNIELFKSTYDRIQEWLIPFPPLPAHIIAAYDDIVKKHDVLGVATDVRAVLDAIVVDRDDNLESRITGFLEEFTVPFHLSVTLAKVNKVLDETLTPITFETLKQLKDPKYTYLLMAHPVDSFDMATDITTAVISSNVVTARLMEATSGIVPGIPRFYAPAVLTALETLNARVAYPIVTQAQFSDHITTSTSACISDGVVRWSPLTPLACFDYQFHVRRELMYEVFKAQDVVAASKFMPTHIINHDLAKHLRTILGHQWSSLMPSSMCYSDQYYTQKMLKSDPEAVRRLLETLSSMPYDLITRTIGNQFNREIWATFMSSFALLYVLPASTDIASITSDKGNGALATYLVTGYGNPYGSNYIELASKQPALEPDELVELYPQIYIRMLKVIPLPSEKMSVSSNFYMQHPYYYYPANSKTIKVEKWVVTDGLMHMSMAPIIGKQTKPKGLFDKRYAYANDVLMIQMELNYNIKKDTITESDFHAPATIHSWPFDRYKQYIEWKRQTVYGVVASTASEISTESTIVKETLKKIESSETAAEADSSIARVEEAKPNLIQSSQVEVIIPAADANKTKPGTKKTKTDKVEEAKPSKEKDDDNEADLKE